MAKLLIADRDIKIRSALETFLQHAGFAVFGADNAKDIIKITKRENPDIVVLDIRIGPKGKMDLDVIDKIKATSKATKVVVTSTYSKSDPEWPMIRARAIDRYYSEPFALDNLVSELKIMSSKILFADDHEESNDMLKSHFEVAGYSCLVATGDEIILKTVEKEKPNIVCLDIRIRGKLASGEVLKKIKEMDPKIRVIMLTTMPSEEAMSRIEKYGATADGYVEKPMDLKAFGEEIKRVARLW